MKFYVIRMYLVTGIISAGRLICDKRVQRDCRPRKYKHRHYLIFGNVFRLPAY